MKKLTLILSIAAGLFTACNNSALKSDTESAELYTTKASVMKQNRLEVYCFHGTRQCETCKNMKANTRKVLNMYFADQLKDSSLVFDIVDVDDVQNEVLAEKFQATGTALMVNKVVNGKDSIIDWSDFAFEKANNEEIYIPELKKMLEGLLK